MIRASSAVLLIVLALAAYSNSFETGFALDSKALTLHDPRVQQVTAANLSAIFQGDYWNTVFSSGLYRPLVTVSWMFNYAVLGNRGQPLGYHAINFALQAVNVLLLWSLVLAVGARPAAAFFGAAIFALHPVGTEAVTNISGRPDLMAAMAVLGGLLLYARGVEWVGLRRALLNGGLFVAALAGLWCKENAIALLPLIVLYDVSFGKRLRNRSRLLASYLAIVGGAGIALLARYGVLSRMRAPEFPFLANPLTEAGFVEARLTAAGVIVRYIKLVLWPRTLSCDYSYHQIPLSSTGEGLMAVAALLTVLAVLAVSYRWSRPVFFFGMLFFVALLPVSNFLLLIGSIMAERFLYLPLAGFAACLAAAVFSVPLRYFRYGAGVALAAALIALGARTYVRNFDWQSDLKLWSSAVEASPGSYKPHHVAASEMHYNGGPEDIMPAIQEEEKSIAIVAGLPPERSTTLPYTILGMLWEQQGDLLARDQPVEAEAAWGKAVEVLQSAIPIDRAYNNARRHKDLARGWPLDRLPDIGNVALYATLGDVQRRRGRYQEALDTHMLTLRLIPDSDTLQGEIADLLRLLGRNEDAAVWAARSLLLGKRPEQLARFIEFYRRVYPDECPAAADARPGNLNLDCPSLKRIVCRGEREMLQFLEETHHSERAAQYRSTRTIVGTCGE